MSTHFDLSKYIYSNLLNSKNVPWQFPIAIANCHGKILLQLLTPNFEGCASKQNVLFSEKCAPKNAPMPSLSRISPEYMRKGFLNSNLDLGKCLYSIQTL